LTKNRPNHQKSEKSRKKAIKMGNLGAFSSRAKNDKLLNHGYLHSKKGQSFFVSRQMQGSGFYFGRWGVWRLKIAATGLEPVTRGL
jgi:hypothetical protein